MDVEKEFAAWFGFKILGYPDQRETDSRGHTLIPGALPHGMRSDEELKYCASHRYGRMYCGRKLADSALDFTCDDCRQRNWIRPLCELCRDVRYDRGTHCFLGSCPAKRDIPGNTAIGDGYRRRDGRLRRWINDQIVPPDVDERLMVIENRYPQLGARARRIEEWAAGRARCHWCRVSLSNPWALNGPTVSARPRVTKSPSTAQQRSRRL